MSDRDCLLATGRTEVGRVQCTQVKLEDDGGDIVTVRDEIHAHSNHYIKQSRRYFPNEKLPTYIRFPYFLGTARVVLFVSLFGALAEPAGCVLLFIACLMFFFVFCQHQWVNQKSLPVVYKQPVFDGQETNNAFYKMTVTELDGVALQNYQAGIGFIKLSQGKIQFQAFTKTAMKYMSDAKCQSRLMLVLFAMAFAYNSYFMGRSFSD
ncbi:uncharacterized protein LOC144656741 [Oculina patagonica]